MINPRFFLLFCALIFAFGREAHAQLVTSFSNLTAINVRRLANAVQIRLESDGTVQFGADQKEWVDFAAGYVPKPTTTLTIRLVQTRAKLPAFVPIDAYPVDGAAIFPGRTSFETPYFSDRGWGQTEPLTDVQLRFATPVIVRKFAPEPYRSVYFGDFLGPREVSVEISSDRRAVVITVVPDRADLGAVARLNRSPLETRKKSLKVSALNASEFALQALNAPLGEVLAKVSEAIQTKFVAREDITNLPISAHLPRADFAILRLVLERGYGVGARQDENGEWIFGRGGEFWSARALALQNLTPDAARLIFPDFLLPQLRPDPAQNALLAFATPLVLDKIEADLKIIDAPRAQFEIAAQVWEIVLSRENSASLRLEGNASDGGLSFDSQLGNSSLRIERGQTAVVRSQLRLLESRGRACLVAAPRVTALAGAAGSLFLGQTRYVKVLQNQNGSQTVRALALKIGTQLDVTPRGAGKGGAIFLDVSPRVSSVDALESETGLPTIGLREVSSNLRLESGQSVIVAGLDAQTNFRARGRTLKVLPSNRRETENRRLVVLIEARRVGEGSKKTENPTF